ncbi:serine/threonine-protein kinase ZRK3 [Citrus sinensis]|nr:serine/threonine-protein kinase ZRK3 [Citrus sinensis]
MGAIIRKFRGRNDKRRLMMRNGTSVLKELIASSNAQMSHNHILKLIGCCLETPIPILVFESVEYGTLRDCIFGATPPQLKIARDIANSLAYLHFGFPRPIVFRNVKTENILFNEENVAKFFDFSLSISIPEGETHITTDGVIGTRGYSAPEYISICVLNEKSDVFSFGAFLFELLAGRIHIWDLLKDTHDHGCFFNEYLNNYLEDKRFTEIAAPIIVQDIPCIEKEQQLHASAQLTLECVNNSPEDKPNKKKKKNSDKFIALACNFLNYTP